MTIHRSRLLQAAACVVGSLVLPLADAVAGVAAMNDCALVGRKVKSAVEEDPANVLVIVEDSLTAHPDCACEIVKGAIIGANADKELVKEIVICAVSTAESKAAEIAECALAAAPDAAEAVKEGLETALGDVGESEGEPSPLVGAPLLKDWIFLLSPLGPSASFSDIQITPTPVSASNPVP